MKKTAIILIIALAFFACDDKDTHTHEWEWVVTTPATTEADGLETETCKTCGAESGETRIIATPQDWETTVDLFETCTAPVKGIALLPSEWNGVANKVATAIIGAFPANPTTSALEYALRLRFINVFGGGYDLVIIVEKTTAYKCKVIYGEFGRLDLRLYFSLNYLNDTGLQATIIEAVLAMAVPKEYKLE